MWGRPPPPTPPHSSPVSAYHPHTVPPPPPCRPPPHTLVMVQPTFPLPPYGAAGLQTPYVLQPMPTTPPTPPTPIWWDHFPGPSYQQEYLAQEPSSHMNGYHQAAHFRKRK